MKISYKVLFIFLFSINAYADIEKNEMITKLTNVLPEGGEYC